MTHVSIMQGSTIAFFKEWAILFKAPLEDNILKRKDQSISATALASISPCELRFVLKANLNIKDQGPTASSRRGDAEHLRFDARARLFKNN